MTAIFAQVAVSEGGYSLFSLFVQATLLVQLVMIGLIIASVVCWAIIFEKFVIVSRAHRATERFEQLFWSGQSLEDLYLSLGPKNNQSMAALFMAAMREWKRSVESSAKLLPGVQMRIDKVLDVAVSREVGRLEKRLLFLATVGATAPFVGLFGTVWGIMNAFRGLGNVHQATLAMVAPGIAEALIATAMGLFAAIPAVIAYNRYSNDVERLENRYDNFLEEFSSILQPQAHD